ncbi:hypothetical protein [Ramlibacter sp.]|uniref:hypothetical protein n=1 Tax=Ramlibacter sp. TaxID=1917967 RepID=UPI003D10E2F6
MRATVSRVLLAAFFAAAALPVHACPKAEDVRAVELHGLWRAEFEGVSSGATLLLEKHPEWVESVAGAINRDGARSLVSGELETGDFTLEESADGIHIAAVWDGAIVDGSCGREIRGTWTRDGETAGRAFRLRKLD